MVDGVILYLIHLAIVWIAWFVVMVGFVWLDGLRSLIYDKLGLPYLDEIADAAFWLATVVTLCYAATDIPITLAKWVFSL
jgi:hypothetical protein